MNKETSTDKRNNRPLIIVSLVCWILAIGFAIASIFPMVSHTDSLAFGLAIPSAFLFFVSVVFFVILAVRNKGERRGLSIALIVLSLLSSLTVTGGLAVYANFDPTADDRKFVADYGTPSALLSHNSSDANWIASAEGEICYDAFDEVKNVILTADYAPYNATPSKEVFSSDKFTYQVSCLKSSYLTFYRSGYCYLYASQGEIFGHSYNHWFSIEINQVERIATAMDKLVVDALDAHEEAWNKAIENLSIEDFIHTLKWSQARYVHQYFSSKLPDHVVDNGQVIDAISNADYQTISLQDLKNCPAKLSFAYYNVPKNPSVPALTFYLASTLTEAYFRFPSFVDRYGREGYPMMECSLDYDSGEAIYDSAYNAVFLAS